jgi:hypothetical protein
VQQDQIDQNNIKLCGNFSKPYGLTYGSWTVKWWQWALSTPLSINPVADDVGENWSVNQPNSHVWFLAGRFGSSERKFPKRVIRMSEGRSILFPVLNCEANPLEYPELKSDDDLVRQTSHDVDTVVKKNCFINGISINPERIVSDPRIFPVTIDKDNAFGVTSGGVTYAAADGYWVFLEPLKKGYYTIDFEGSCEFGRLSAGASYQVYVK